MEEQTVYSLRHEVNPVFTTAQSCVRVMAELGDEDSGLLVDRLDFDANKNSTATTDEVDLLNKVKSIPGFAETIEARFECSNQLIENLGYRFVLDIPCGYTSRGLKLARKDIRYYGCDLPAVIDAVEPAAKSIIGGSGSISYHEVDATNYDSIRRCLDDVRGGLLITTEGLLMYMTQSELEEIFVNMKRLLTEFGGVWITTDNMIIPSQQAIMAASMGEEAYKEAVCNLPDPPPPLNLFLDVDKAPEFIDRMGFELERVSIGEYMPDELLTLKDLPEDKKREVKKAMGVMEFWMMKVKPDSVSGSYTRRATNFSADCKRENDQLLFRLSGRIDTITSPDLLSVYREADDKSIRTVRMDMTDVSYISSAGLRVLMIMLGDHPDNVKLDNVNEDIMEILRTTGFDSILFGEE